MSLHTEAPGLASCLMLPELTAAAACLAVGTLERRHPYKVPTHRYGTIRSSVEEAASLSAPAAQAWCLDAQQVYIGGYFIEDCRENKKESVGGGTKSRKGPHAGAFGAI